MSVCVHRPACACARREGGSHRMCVKEDGHQHLGVDVYSGQSPVSVCAPWCPRRMCAPRARSQGPEPAGVP